MHLQQTKRASRDTGGPQYYFHDLSKAVKAYLRQQGAVRVALFTPYGATKSDYFAVSENRKLASDLRPIPGRVGHDRVQQGRASESIGESIRKWYRLPLGDFERINVDIEIRDDVFYLIPLSYRYAARGKAKVIATEDRPLTFTREYVSKLWKEQLHRVQQEQSGIVEWALEEICRIVKDHRQHTKVSHIQEQDLLRASGPLKHLGVSLGGYVGKGYDCLSQFSFRGYPSYTIPVEIKKDSSGFAYQQRKYGKNELSRAVILCTVHGHRQLPRNIDVIELEGLCRYAHQSV